MYEFAGSKSAKLDVVQKIREIVTRCLLQYKKPRVSLPGVPSAFQGELGFFRVALPCSATPACNSGEVNTKNADYPGLRIRTHFIRIQHFRLKTDPDPL
jgi:hypothetical protein